LLEAAKSCDAYLRLASIGPVGSQGVLFEGARAMSEESAEAGHNHRAEFSVGWR